MGHVLRFAYKVHHAAVGGGCIYVDNTYCALLTPPRFSIFIADSSALISCGIAPSRRGRSGAPAGEEVQTAVLNT